MLAPISIGSGTKTELISFQSSNNGSRSIARLVYARFSSESTSSNYPRSSFGAVMKSSSFFDILRSRKMVSLLLLGFASGLPAQALEGPLQLWLKEQQVDPGQITAIGAMATFPYAWKFLWSPVIDRFVPPVFSKLGRRQSWLLLTQAALIVLLVLMAAQNPSTGNLGLFTAIAVGIGFFSASQDIASDAYRTDVLDKREAGTGVALWTNGFRIAVLVAGNLIIGLADEKKVGHWSWPQVYLLIAGLLAIGCIASLWAPKPANESRNIAPASLRDAVVLPFEDFLNRKKVVGGTTILLFILTYKLGDYMVKSVAKLFFKDIGFSATDIGNTGALGIVAAIFGAICGGLIMLKIGMNRSLWVATIGSSITVLPYELLAQVNQPDLNLLLLATAGESFTAGFEATVFVAFMMSLCDRRFSATQYALFSSFMLAGRSFIVGPMGGFYKNLGGSSYFWLCILAAIPSLILLSYVAPLSVKQVMKSGAAKSSNNLYGAIDDFNHAIDLNPRQTEAYHKRGLLQAELGKRSTDRGISCSEDKTAQKTDYYQDAIAHYQGAITDLNRVVNSDLANIHVDKQLVEIQTATRETCNLALDLQPNRGSLYGDRGVLNFNLGDQQAALTDLDRAITLGDLNVNNFDHRGKVRYHLGDQLGAISDLNEAIKLDPKQPEHYKNLAWVQLQQGQTQAAIDNCQIAIKLNPQDPDVQSILDAATSTNSTKQRR